MGANGKDNQIKISSRHSRVREKNMAQLLADFQDSIGIITFNNDAKRNALSRALLHELIKALNEMIYQSARVIMLRSNKGAAVWSAGHDISEFPRPGRTRCLMMIPWNRASGPFNSVRRR